MPHSSPTPSLFTLHRHLINMPLSRQRGGKTQSVPPAEDALIAVRASSGIDCRIPRLLPKTIRLQAIEAVCAGYTQHTTCGRQNGGTLCSSWTASRCKTAALAATEIVQEANTWRRTEEGGGVEESESMQRSPVTQQSPATNPSSPAPFSVFFALSDTSTVHLRSERSLPVKISDGHRMYVYDACNVTYTTRDTPPFPPPLLQAPLWVVTATRLQLYDPTLCNACNIQHAAKSQRD